MDLVEIVPIEDNLLIEAKIRPADIAFLRPGQNGMIKLTAYDFSIYGGMPAKLERISADTISDDNGDSFYLIYLRTEKNYIGKESDGLEIIPGMTTTVDILTGKKTILDYLLKPILKAKSEALRER
jgi:adhesin transport system membrane fusion protein